MTKATKPLSQNASFLTGLNAEYIAHLYSQYLRNSGSVDKSWRDFFAGLQDNEVALLKELHGASWTPDENRSSSRKFDSSVEVVRSSSANAGGASASQEDVQVAAMDSVRALQLIHAYRGRGHMLADLDPLE